MSKERYLMSMTPSQIAAAASDPNALVLLPTAAIEQHGPHLPVGVDSLLGNAFLQRILSELSDDDPLWIAPPIWVGKSNEHDGFPGTLTISANSLRNQVLTTVKQLERWGFRRVAILNSHGGNSPVLRTTVCEIENSMSIKASILSSYPKTGLNPREERFGIHAGQYETALMLAIQPELVDMEKADCHWMDERFPAGNIASENAPATFAWKTADLSPSGTLGDATKATASEGEQWLSAVVELLHRQIRSLLDADS
ncbi:creatininase family protein [Cerasicoccus maritimus]|uniref:creatininase family protein n=1 Tax=Cerasicoccus maritimus TaxID=490089 RepID=UPI0028525889|nr:creatininase family protein [Cerasicoccus maritimus]